MSLKIEKRIEIDEHSLRAFISEGLKIPPDERGNYTIRFWRNGEQKAEICMSSDVLLVEAQNEIGAVGVPSGEQDRDEPADSEEVAITCPEDLELSIADGVRAQRKLDFDLLHGRVGTRDILSAYARHLGYGVEVDPENSRPKICLTGERPRPWVIGEIAGDVTNAQIQLWSHLQPCDTVETGRCREADSQPVQTPGSVPGGTFSSREKRRILKHLLDPLPPLREWYRASGACICDRCLCEYRLHPTDPDSQPDVVLCNGDRVHL